MISRRAFLGTGVGVAAVGGAATLAHSTHRLDDIARAVGIKPSPQPAESDTRLIARVVHDQNALLGKVEATSARHPTPNLKPFVEIAQAHVEAVGGSTRIPQSRPVDAASLAKTYAAASKARAKDAGKAVSPDLARVLASMSASLAQCAKAVGEL